MGTERPFEVKINAMKREASRDIGEIYDLAKQVDFKAAEAVLGPEVFSKSLVELQEFAQNAKNAVKEVDSKVKDVEGYNRQALKIEIIMSNLKNQFDWENPLLDFVQEVE